MDSTTSHDDTKENTVPDTFHIHVNAAEHTVAADGDTPLLYILRNDLGLNGPKFGCGLAPAARGRRSWARRRCAPACCRWPASAMRPGARWEGSGGPASLVQIRRHS